MKTFFSLSIAALSLAATPALADLGATTDWARVVDVDPIYETIRHRVPVRDCWMETRYEPVDRGRGSYTPGLLGAVIGGALGNELGHNKSNKRVGAVVGAALGASIARDIDQHRRGHRSERVHPVREEVCETSERVEYEEQLVGYNVTYRYQDRTYHTQMSEHPGKRLRVAVNVTPVY